MITDKQVVTALLAFYHAEAEPFVLPGSGAGDLPKMRAALEAVQPLTVADDPVREAARKFAAAIGWVTDEELVIRAFEFRAATAEALAQPAPPSLTENERKALSFAAYRSDPNPNVAALKSAREKLS